MDKTFYIRKQDTGETLTISVSASLDDVVDFAIMLREQYALTCDITYSPPIPFLDTRPKP